MPQDVDSEKLLDWIGLSKKLKMTNENIVKNLQFMLTNTRFETDVRLQKIGESAQVIVQLSPEPTVQPEAPAQPAQSVAQPVPSPAQTRAAAQPAQPTAPTQPEAAQVITEQQFDSLSEIQFTILKAMNEATETYNLKTFSRKVNLDTNRIIQQVQELAKKGFLQKVGNGYLITEKGKALVSTRAGDKSENPDKQEKEETATNEKKRNKWVGGFFNFSLRGE